MAKILIVDWDEEERVALWSILAEAGHELLYAENGRVALEVYRKHPTDLVITELAMPELNGFLLIRELLERDPSARIVAISLTNAENLDLAEELGACCILFKPVDPQALLEAVEKAVDQPGGRRDKWR